MNPIAQSSDLYRMYATLALRQVVWAVREARKARGGASWQNVADVAHERKVWENAR